MGNKNTKVRNGITIPASELPVPVGDNGQIPFYNSGDWDTSADLRYDESKHMLTNGSIDYITAKQSMRQNDSFLFESEVNGHGTVTMTNNSTGLIEEWAYYIILRSGAFIVTSYSSNISVTGASVAEKQCFITVGSQLTIKNNSSTVEYTYNVTYFKY